MNECVVDFLPAQLRRRGATLTSRRRNALLVGLLSVTLVGVAAHSWNQYRAADARRAVSMSVATSSGKVDELIERLAAEQRELSRQMSITDSLALPLEMSDLAATVTHLMPMGTSLSMLRIERAEQRAPARTAEAAKPGPTSPAGSVKPAAKRPDRGLDVTIRGYARGNADLYEFERRLSGTAPFGQVIVSENTPIDVPGGHVQQFAITCRVSLDGRRYAQPEATANGPVARAKGVAR
jgi:hypothetical protein